MKVLLGQVRVVTGDVRRNVERIALALDAHPQAELAAFPELSLTGYDLSVAPDLAVQERDEVFDPIRDAARRNRTAVVVGFAERRRREVANSAACIDCDGTWSATYRKTQLFGEEPDVFTPGDELIVVTLAGRRVAPLICFDVEFPEPARAVSSAGAELLVTVAANMAPYGPDHAKAIAARALENRRPHLYVNHVGEQGGHTFVGQSSAIRSDGEAQLVLDGTAASIVCDLSLERPPPELDYLSLLRPIPPVNEINPPLEEISFR